MKVQATSSPGDFCSILGPLWHPSLVEIESVWKEYRLVVSIHVFI